MDIEKLKAEFEKLEYINEKLEYLNFDEHLGCYVEKSSGMPVGLAAWVNGAYYCFESQQDEIDSLIFRVADMKSRLNDNYTAGQTSMYLTKQAEIDDLKAQLKAAHESRIEFVEYCRMIKNNDFALMPKEPTREMLIAADNCAIDGKVTAHNIYKAMIAAAQEPK